MAGRLKRSINNINNMRVNSWVIVMMRLLNGHKITQQRRPGTDWLTVHGEMKRALVGRTYKNHFWIIVSQFDFFSRTSLVKHPPTPASHPQTFLSDDEFISCSWLARYEYPSEVNFESRLQENIIKYARQKSTIIILCCSACCCSCCCSGKRSCNKSRISSRSTFNILSFDEGDMQGNVPPLLIKLQKPPNKVMLPGDRTRTERKREGRNYEDAFDQQDEIKRFMIPPV